MSTMVALQKKPVVHQSHYGIDPLGTMTVYTENSMALHQTVLEIFSLYQCGRPTNRMILGHNMRTLQPLYCIVTQFAFTAFIWH